MNCYNFMFVYYSIGNGGWALEGVKTVAISEPEEESLGTFHVVCETQHLTSFAVLVDVSKSDRSDESEVSLTLKNMIICHSRDAGMWTQAH